MTGYTKPDAIEHSKAASMACVNVVHARHCGEAVWWAAIARRQAIMAELAEHGETVA